MKPAYLFIAFLSIISAVSGEELSERMDVSKICQEIVHDLLAPLENIYLPYLPLFFFNPSADINISFSVADINVTGIADVKILECNVPVGIRPGHLLEIKMNFPRLLITATNYTAGGHLFSVPFAGKSYMFASFEDFSITAGMNTTKFSLVGPNVCILPNSTYLSDTAVRKPIIYLDSLDPGTDLGQLINNVASITMNDFFDYIDDLVNGPLHGLYDKLLVNGINKRFCKDKTGSSFYEA